ncbi:MAG: MotA/TolQ/ExbB proton channel family protein [Elusimicrobiota bacterium]
MGGFDVGLKETLAAGWFTLGILGLLSVYSTGLIAQRWIVFKRSMGSAPDFLARLRRCVESGKLKEALDLCKRYPGSASAVVMASMVGPSGKAERRAAAERTLERQVSRLEHGLPALGTIGSTAPFIGLFGTVLGVIRAFRDLAGAANAGPGVVATGISEALWATAAGLFVAIPAIIAYNYFTTRANSFGDELRWIVDEILERLTERPVH